MKIGERRRQVGEKIGNIVDKSNKTTNLTDTLQPLYKAMEIAQKAPKTNSAVINRLQDSIDDLTLLMSDNLEDASLKVAFDLKKQVGNMTKWTGAASDDQAVNKALRGVYGKLKGKMETAIPSIKSLNERYADLTSAEIASNYRNNIVQRQNLIGMQSGSTGLATALLTSLATGGQFTPSVLAGAGATTLTNILRNPAIKTRVAAILSKASPSVRQQLYEKIPNVMQAIEESLGRVAMATPAISTDAINR